MSQITFGGLASGLDTSAIINALMQVKQIPILQLQSNKQTEQDKLDLLGSLKAKVEVMRDKAEGLSSLSDFLKSTSTISDPGAANITLTGAAPIGSHTLEVLSLANADRYTWDGVGDSDTTELGAGTVDFTYNGTVYSVNVGQTSSTLDGIASAINTAAGDDVTASVVNAGTLETPSYQLVLAGNETGEDYAITGLTTSVAGLANQDQIVKATNASIVVDGLTIERASNQFTGVLPGVDIDVLATTAGVESFTIDTDKDAIKAELQGFVDAYNDVIDFIEKQNTYSEEDGAGGELFGDSVLRSVKGIMQSSMFSVDLATVQADTAGFSTLSLVGISVDTSGRLSMDDTVVDDKLGEDLAAFADLFVDTDGFDNAGALPNTPGYYVDTTADSGLMATLFRSLDQATELVTAADGTSLKGLFDRREETYKSNIDRFDDRIEELERRLEKYEEGLIAKFSNLEQLMGGLNAQQSFLNSIAAA